MLRVFFAISLVALFWVSFDFSETEAAFNEELNYQAKLTDVAGDPVSIASLYNACIVYPHGERCKWRHGSVWSERNGISGSSVYAAGYLGIHPGLAFHLCLDQAKAWCA